MGKLSKDMRQSVMEFLKKNKKISYKKFHEWAERRGFSTDKAEETAYGLASRYSSFALGGKSKGKMPKGVDPKEVKDGTKVELEHTDNKEDAKKITADHLVETKKLSPNKQPKGYYPRLESMENDIKKNAEFRMKIAGLTVVTPEVIGEKNKVDLLIEKIAKKLTTADRRALPTSSFAVPKGLAKKEEPNQPPAKGVKGKYPMPDKSHAVSAVSYVQRYGTPAEKKRVFTEAANKFNVGPYAKGHKKVAGSYFGGHALIGDDAKKVMVDTHKKQIRDLSAELKKKKKPIQKKVASNDDTITKFANYLLNTADELVSLACAMEKEGINPFLGDPAEEE